MSERARFRIYCDEGDGEMQVASVEGPREEAQREAGHYAAVYAQDGKVRIEEVKKREKGK